MHADHATKHRAAAPQQSVRSRAQHSITQQQWHNGPLCCSAATWERRQRQPLHYHTHMPEGTLARRPLIQKSSHKSQHFMKHTLNPPGPPSSWHGPRCTTQVLRSVAGNGPRTTFCPTYLHGPAAVTSDRCPTGAHTAYTHTHVLHAVPRGRSNDS